jgi:hypothetical protein
MTILNTASDGFFNVLIVLHRALTARGPMDRERLIGLCSPGPDGDAARLGATLLRWTQLGLFKKSEDGKYSLDNADKDPERLPSRCRRLLLNETNNQNFWDNEGTLAADFTRALAFVLAQDIYAEEFAVHAKVQALEQRQVADEGRRVLQNDVRWNGLRFWGDFLGFFWVDLRRWPDPTAAVRDELPVVFGDRTELPAADFVARLSEHLPVLDGGRYRLQVEAALNPAEWHPPANPKLLSTSLSRALWRLSQPGGPMRLERRADAADNRTLQRSGGREWQTFTHVLLIQGAGACR